MKTTFYMLASDNQDGFIPCDTALCAYRQTMNRFATDKTLKRITIWKYNCLSQTQTLWRSYTREDYNHVKVVTINRKGNIERHYQIVKVL